jgi:diaminopimelate decarboxylase
MERSVNTGRIEKIFQKAIREHWIREEDTAVMFHDLDYLRERILHLCSLFPANTLHALAIKANPLIRIMEFTRNVSPQIGVEAASIGEVKLALHCSYDASRIIYDSPVKTHSELEEALNMGIALNIDNLAELDRVGEILEKRSTSSKIGIRVNPQVGTGSIAESSVAGEYSKFGVPVRQHRMKLLEVFKEKPWLTGLHLHVGSQGCPLELLVEGVRVIDELRKEIVQITGLENRIQFVDIGGGMPVRYTSDQHVPTMQEYADLLRSEVPELFTLHSSLFTEFGRWVFVNSGWTASRVEYVKKDPGINTAMIHTGADLFVRECLNPHDWRHEYSVLDKTGKLKTGRSDSLWNLAGPLCFSGDILAKNVPLPEIEEGDYIIIHDTGGYTFSMWSRYNSRNTPRILGYRDGDFEILKERESMDQIISFWG